VTSPWACSSLWSRSLPLPTLREREPGTCLARRRCRSAISVSGRHAHGRSSSSHACRRRTCGTGSASFPWTQITGLLSRWSWVRVPPRAPPKWRIFRRVAIEVRLRLGSAVSDSVITCGVMARGGRGVAFARRRKFNARSPSFDNPIAMACLAERAPCFRRQATSPRRILLLG
jgi:hypothetical protein